MDFENFVSNSSKKWCHCSLNDILSLNDTALEKAPFYWFFGGFSSSVNYYKNIRIGEKNFYAGISYSSQWQAGTISLIRETANRFSVWHLHQSLEENFKVFWKDEREMPITHINNYPILEAILKRNNQFLPFNGLKIKDFYPKDIPQFLEAIYICSDDYYLSFFIDILIPKDYRKKYGRPEISKVHLVSKKFLSFEISSISYARYLIDEIYTVKALFNLETFKYETYEVSCIEDNKR